MNRVIPGADWRGEGLFLLKILLSGGAAVLSLFVVIRIIAYAGVVNHSFLSVTSDNSFTGNVLVFLGCTVVCVMVYVAVMIALQTKEIIEIKNILREKVRRRG